MSMNVANVLCRTFKVPITGGPNDGTFPISAQTTTPDVNPSNNQDSTVVRLVRTCGNPLGNGTALSCPAGSGYVGPDNQTFNSTTEFGAKCCVSETG